MTIKRESEVICQSYFQANFLSSLKRKMYLCTHIVNFARLCLMNIKKRSILNTRKQYNISNKIRNI